MNRISQQERWGTWDEHWKSRCKWWELKLAVFQKCLLRNDESVERKSMIDNNDSFHVVVEDDRQKYETISNVNGVVGGNLGLLNM